MKLKKLKSIGHNSAASYLSTLSLIGDTYTSTVLYRLALKMGISSLELDVVNKTTVPSIGHSGIITSLSRLNGRFIELLDKEGIPFQAIKDFKLIVEPLGTRLDIVDFCCRPIVVDANNKEYVCSAIFHKYPEPI